MRPRHYTCSHYRNIARTLSAFFFLCTVQCSADINESRCIRRFINTDLALHSPTLQSWLIKVLYVCLAAPPQFLQFIFKQYILLHLFSSVISFHSSCCRLPSLAYAFFYGCLSGLFCVHQNKEGWIGSPLRSTARPGSERGQKENPQKLMNMLNMRWPRALFSVCVYVCCQDALCTASATGCPS